MIDGTLRDAKRYMRAAQARPASPRHGLTIDQGALYDAQGTLGLRLDVAVKLERLRPAFGCKTATVLGRYWGTDPFHPMHRISINPFCATTRATSAALWHELVHALQCERVGSYPRFDSEYQRQIREANVPRDAGYYSAYKAIPYEQEADEYQLRAMRGELPLLVYAVDGCST